MKLSKNKFIFFALFWLMPSVFAASPQSAADELVQLLNNIHTMQANFEQFVANNKDAATKGSMALERPGKFRWEILNPNKQLIVINGKNLWVYDIDLAQVTKRKVNYKNPGNPAMLLSGSTKALKEIFKITKLKKPTEGVVFELRPKKEDTTGSNYKWIRICFVVRGLKSMRILDNFDQQTEIQFSNVVFNSKISQDKFKFVVPKKVDVLDEG